MILGGIVLLKEALSTAKCQLAEGPGNLQVTARINNGHQCENFSPLKEDTGKQRVSIKAVWEEWMTLNCPNSEGLNLSTHEECSHSAFYRLCFRGSWLRGSVLPSPPKRACCNAQEPHNLRKRFGSPPSRFHNLT